MVETYFNIQRTEKVLTLKKTFGSSIEFKTHAKGKPSASPIAPTFFGVPAKRKSYFKIQQMAFFQLAALYCR